MSRGGDMPTTTSPCCAKGATSHSSPAHVPSQGPAHAPVSRTDAPCTHRGAGQACMLHGRFSRSAGHDLPPPMACVTTSRTNGCLPPPQWGSEHGPKGTRGGTQAARGDTWAWVRLGQAWVRL